MEMNYLVVGRLKAVDPNAKCGGSNEENSQKCLSLKAFSSWLSSASMLQTVTEPWISKFWSSPDGNPDKTIHLFISLILMHVIDIKRKILAIFINKKKKSSGGKATNTRYRPFILKPIFILNGFRQL